MVVVYRVPAVVPDHVVAAFEERGVRLRPGDMVVLDGSGSPAVVRELDHAITPFLQCLPVDYAEGVPPCGQPEPRRRRGDRPPYLRLVRPSEGRPA